MKEVKFKSVFRTLLNIYDSAILQIQLMFKTRYFRKKSFIIYVWWGLEYAF